MFNPTPPKSDSDPQPGGQEDPRPVTASAAVRPSTAALFLGAAVTCQALSLLATLLPWTRSGGQTFAGYQAYYWIPLNYDGTAGRLNLFASGILLFFGFLVMVGSPVRFASDFFRIIMLAWNVGLSIWLFVIYRHLSVYYIDAYGLPTTLALSVIVAFCVLVSLVTTPAEAVQRGSSARKRTGTGG